MIVDRLTLDDLPAALALSTQAGWNQLAQDWERLLELSPDGCFAGRLDGRLVATATCASPAPGIRWIGMVLVDEARRGRGVGRILLERALAHAGKEEDVGLDATDLGRPLYLKLGFQDVAPVDRWGGVPAGPAEVETGDVDTLLALDRAAAGVDRSRLLRRLAAEPGARILTSGDGAAVLRPGRLASHMGPVIAKDVETFDALLRGAAAHLRGSPMIVDVPRTPERESVLGKRGLSVRRALTRMTRGAPRPLLLTPRLAGAVSFEWA